MAYVLTLLAILAVFLWATPAHKLLTENFKSTVDVVRHSVSSSGAPLTAHMRNAVSSVREKAMELLRKELHRSVDSLVR